MTVLFKGGTVISTTGAELAEILVENGTYFGEKGHGQFVARGLSSYLI